jgi:prepilin-type N-terminal cleavage/methylation domain-containing protein
MLFKHIEKIRTKTPAGFTLIELLVVISIIALLSSVVLVSVSMVKTKTNDTKIAEDLRQFRIAVELYYNANGVYPPVAFDNQNKHLAGNNNDKTSWINSFSLFTKKAEADAITLCTNFNTIADNLVSKKFLSKRPVHPYNNPSAGVCYKAFRATDGSYFTMYAPLSAKLSNGYNKRTGFILVNNGTVDSKIAAVYTDTEAQSGGRGFPADITSASPSSITAVADEIQGVTKGASVSYGGASSFNEPPVLPATYQFFLSIAYGQGQVYRNPDLSSYPAGTQVHISAVEDDGYYFAHWMNGSGENSTDCPLWNDSACTVIMNSDKTIRADFREVSPL